MRFPVARLVVISDDEPEAVIEIKFDGEERALVVYVVPCLVSYGFKCRGFEVFLRNVAASSMIKSYAGLEHFLGSGRCLEVRFNVTGR